MSRKGISRLIRSHTIARCQNITCVLTFYRFLVNVLHSHSVYGMVTRVKPAYSSYSLHAKDSHHLFVTATTPGPSCTNLVQNDLYKASTCLKQCRLRQESIAETERQYNNREGDARDSTDTENMWLVTDYAIITQESNSRDSLYEPHQSLWIPSMNKQDH